MAEAAARGWIKQIDWGRIAPLRLRARSVAEGVYAGTHRSRRRGPGIEFGGHRPYVPGDDLRWIDRHALMRHDRLLVREFETETDRGLHLVVDATASMSFRGQQAPGAKLAFAALVAAALAHVALRAKDPVSLNWVGGEGTRAVTPTCAGDAFERIVAALGDVRAAGDLRSGPQAVEGLLASVHRRARRGAVIVVLSDLLDLPSGSQAQLAALGTNGRKVVAVQVLDREELTLPYAGTVQLRALEGDALVETEPEVVRELYVARLHELTERWTVALASHGGRVVPCPTDADPVDIVTTVLRVVAEESP